MAIEGTLLGVEPVFAKKAALFSGAKFRLGHAGGTRLLILYLGAWLTISR